MQFRTARTDQHRGHPPCSPIATRTPNLAVPQMSARWSSVWSGEHVGGFAHAHGCMANAGEGICNTVKSALAACYVASDARPDARSSALGAAPSARGRAQCRARPSPAWARRLGCGLGRIRRPRAPGPRAPGPSRARARLLGPSFAAASGRAYTGACAWRALAGTRPGAQSAGGARRGSSRRCPMA